LLMYLCPIRTIEGNLNNPRCPGGSHDCAVSRTYPHFAEIPANPFTWVELEEASQFYELAAPSKQSRPYTPLFRCLRSLTKATLGPRPAPSNDSRIESTEYCNKTRLLKAQPPMSDYLVRPIGACENPEIGRGGSSQAKFVRSPEAGNIIAVKYFSGPTLDKLSFTRKIESLAKLYHPCVLQIIHWAFPEGVRCGEIHTEVAERGSRDNLLKERKSESGRQFWTWTRIGIVLCDIVLECDLFI
jgi:hypothetical protein